MIGWMFSFGVCEMPLMTRVCSASLVAGLGLYCDVGVWLMWLGFILCCGCILMYVGCGWIVCCCGAVLGYVICVCD